MTSPLRFVQLPVVPDQGLPQAFTCAIGATYDFGLYANLEVPETDLPETLYDLAAAVSPAGYLVLRIVRQGADGPRVILLRKLIPEPDLIHFAHELAIRVTQAVIARGNLNGAGHFGTQIGIGVAQRWA
jgi:hypothetical protein